MKKKKKVIEKRGQNALNALNVLNVRHRKILKNVPDRLLMIMKKKVTNRIEKRGEVTEIGSPIQPKKLRRRNEKRLKGRFSSKSVDFFTNILLIEIMTANPPRLPRKESRRWWTWWKKEVEEKIELACFYIICCHPY